MKTPIDMQAGTLHSSNNFGDFEIVGYANKTNVTIRFKATQEIYIVGSSEIRKGKVKDYKVPVLYKIGYLGRGKYKSSIKGKNTLAYKTWQTMLARCYCPKFHKKQPTYSKAFVATVWHNFQNFAKWFEANYIEGYQLDKDVHGSGDKMYSPQTCTFITAQQNAEEANAKHWSFISPIGEVKHVFNLNTFCKQEELDHSGMRKVHLGIHTQHKGWTRYETRDN